MGKYKTIFMNILRYLLALFMIYAGVQHFLKPDFYIPFVPEFLPYTKFFILVSGVVEVLLGVMLIFKANIAKYGALGLFFLMLAFLPIHIRDIIVENPAIGSHEAALIRLPFQFVFMAWSYGVYYFLKKRNENV